MKYKTLGLLCAFALVLAGCSSGSDVGATVESPPRDLVEKSMPKTGGGTPPLGAPK